MTSKDTVTIADYILARLVQLGVRSVFGAPGDVGHSFVNHIHDHAGLNWIGCCNELNAAYAADGYARASKGLGVVVTTSGAGAFGAVNAIAGAFREQVPLVHIIIGMPSTSQQPDRKKSYRTLSGDCSELYSKVTTELEMPGERLVRAAKAGSQIDTILISASWVSRPAYLTLPTDLVAAKVPSAPLARPLTREVIDKFWHREPSNAALQSCTTAVEEVARLFKAAKNPAIIIGACAVRFNAAELVYQFAVAARVPFFTTVTTKGAINEKDALFGGVFIGEKSAPAIKANTDKVDFLLGVGLLESDLNGVDVGFHLSAEAIAELHPEYTKVGGTLYFGVTFFTMLPRLTELLRTSSQVSQKPLLTKAGLFASIPPPSNKLDTPRQTPITHAWFWPTFAAYFKEGDVILSEPGAPSLGVVDVEWPQGAIAVSQKLHGASGWSMAATLGAATATAQASPKQRCVAFIGDGGVRVGVQELSTMLRNQLAPVIILLNNDGYTAKHNTNDSKRAHHDVTPWRWGSILYAFGAAPAMANVHNVSTRGELLTVLDAGFAPDKLTLVEVVLDKMDRPRLLKMDQ